MAALVDTNILVYRFDARFADKQRIANEILRQGILEDSVVTRPIRGHVILRQTDALREAQELLEQLRSSIPTKRDYH